MRKLKAEAGKRKHQTTSPGSFLTFPRAFFNWRSVRVSESGRCPMAVCESLCWGESWCKAKSGPSPCRKKSAEFPVTCAMKQGHKEGKLVEIKRGCHMLRGCFFFFLIKSKYANETLSNEICTNLNISRTEIWILDEGSFFFIVQSQGFTERVLDIFHYHFINWKMQQQPLKKRKEKKIIKHCTICHAQNIDRSKTGKFDVSVTISELK